MYGWLIKKVAQRAFARLGEGDPALARALLADDARFRFPGRHPFAADVRSKEDISRWLGRFAHFRPRFVIHDVVASGPPWNLRAAISWTDSIGDPADSPYVNEGVCLMRMRWGQVVEERVYVDTQAVADFFGTETAEEFFADMPAEA